MTSYQSAIVSIASILYIFELFEIEEYRDLEVQANGTSRALDMIEPMSGAIRLTHFPTWYLRGKATYCLKTACDRQMDRERHRQTDTFGQYSPRHACHRAAKNGPDNVRTQCRCCKLCCAQTVEVRGHKTKQIVAPVMHLLHAYEVKNAPK